MLLHKVDEESFNREMSLKPAREAACFIKSWITHLQTTAHGELRKTSTASKRHRTCCSGPTVVVPWSITAEILVNCAKVLRGMGQADEANEVMEDALSVLRALKALERYFPLRKYQACPELTHSESADRLPQAAQII